ncbi:DegT/DnrJ/EryC1/StrS family aminotransferase [Streptomyces sp. NPDC024089]|uniref:DegT/DnrJ/EryC1/StrS family aminotransferase n=1 Tax=Streptomyces sp. NPDC024089 TaxID=3154328 RepID=UPI0033D4E3E6
MNTPSIPVAAPRLEAADIAAAVRVLESGHLVQGPRPPPSRTSSRAWSTAASASRSTPTSALWLTLLALGIGPGDEVIVPSFAFAATAAAVRLTGAVLVFADITPDTFCLDPDAFRDLVLGHSRRIATLHDGLHAVLVANAALHASRTGTTTTVPTPEQLHHP